MYYNFIIPKNYDLSSQVQLQMYRVYGHSRQWISYKGDGIHTTEFGTDTAKASTLKAFGNLKD